MTNIVIPTPVPASDELMYRATALAALVQDVRSGDRDDLTPAKANRAEAELVDAVKALAADRGWNVFEALSAVTAWASQGH